MHQQLRVIRVRELRLLDEQASSQQQALDAVVYEFDELGDLVCARRSRRVECHRPVVVFGKGAV